jgi:hypothetical protein
MEFTYHPTTFLDAEVSLFKDVFSPKPIKTITYRDWLIKENEVLKDKVNRVRAEQNKKLKLTLPCITGSGIISDGRADKNLKHHNGYIVLDIDEKENLHLKKEYFSQLKKKVFRKFSEICYAGHSVGGVGYYLIIGIENPNRHKEYFNYLANWFRYSEDINIDKTCKNLSRLRYYSVDDNPHINENATILKENVLNKIAVPTVARRVVASGNNMVELVEKIEASRISIAPSYDEYLKLAIVFFNEHGEDGRGLYHRVCSLDPSYDAKDCDKQFNEVSKRNYTQCSKGTLVHLMKKYNVI